MVKKKYLIAVNIVLMFASLIGVFLLSEAALRLTKFRFLLPEHRYSYPDHYFKRDDISGFDIVEDFAPSFHKNYDGYIYEIWSNSLGCFDRPYEPGVERNVLLLGDSFTWGYTRFEKKWGTVLENAIGERVLKCGVSGYGTKQALMKLRKLGQKLQGQPEVVVLGYYPGNDVSDDYLFPNFTVVDGLRVNKKYIDYLTGGRLEYSDEMLKRNIGHFRETLFDSFMSRDSFIFAFLNRKSVIYHLALRIPVVYNAAISLKIAPKGRKDIDVSPGYFAFDKNSRKWLIGAWKMHFENLRELKAEVQAMDAVLVIVVIPDKVRIDDSIRSDNKATDLDFDYSYNAIMDFCRHEKIHCLDLSSGMREYAEAHKDYDIFFKLDAHWNERGNELAGLLVAEYMIDEGIIALEGRDEKQRSVKNRLETIK
jgi:hypothetical protein